MITLTPVQLLFSARANTILVQPLDIFCDEAFHSINLHIDSLDLKNSRFYSDFKSVFQNTWNVKVIFAHFLDQFLRQN